MDEQIETPAECVMVRRGRMWTTTGERHSHINTRTLRLDNPKSPQITPKESRNIERHNTRKTRSSKQSPVGVRDKVEKISSTRQKKQLSCSSNWMPAPPLIRPSVDCSHQDVHAHPCFHASLDRCDVIGHRNGAEEEHPLALRSASGDMFSKTMRRSSTSRWNLSDVLKSPRRARATPKSIKTLSLSG